MTGVAGPAGPAAPAGSGGASGSAGAAAPRPGSSQVDRVRRVVVTEEGPVMVEGPVEVVMEDGRIARSDRAIVALCTCRRSRIAPFCDTSHRTKVRAERVERPDGPVAPGGPEARR